MKNHLNKGITTPLAIIIILILTNLVIGITHRQYSALKDEIEPPKEKTCQDKCGDGFCDEVVCLAIGCPCAETKENCPEDCENDFKNCDDYERLMSVEEIENCTCPLGYEKFRGLSYAYCATNSQKPCDSYEDCLGDEQCISDDGISWYCTGRITGCYHQDPENPNVVICVD